MILEGIVTTRNADGSVNIAPMGPKICVDEAGQPSFTRLLLRPFKTSLTYTNLARDRCGVFHVTDDMLLLAKAAILDKFETPATVACAQIDSQRLADCCRYFEFLIDDIDASSERSSMEAKVVHAAHVRDFFGLNRAKHAVVEAAILATRRHLIPAEEIQAELARLRPLIDKTGGPAEQKAFELLVSFVSTAEVER